MEDAIECLCQKIWDVLDVEKEKFVHGWRRVEEITEKVSSIPLNIRLLLAAVGFYDPIQLSTLTEKELEIAESRTCIDIGMMQEASCGSDHNCEEAMRKGLWGSYYNRPESFYIKPGYKNVLLLISRMIKENRDSESFGRSYSDVTPEKKPQIDHANNSLVKNNIGHGGHVQSAVQSFPHDKNTYDTLLRKINKWIMSKNTNCLKNYPVLNIKFSSRGGAEITCPFCDNNIRATYHNRKWVTSNFQKHYEKHFSSKVKKDQPAQDDSIGTCKPVMVKTEDLQMETNEEHSEGDPLYF
ncbi:uncharacterized protein LOC129805631 [Phlebotomus papatasi]|uniref:uncharacterized protein LOC129805631 n=1 Tax=Phlebotomus papatasi TaxID=29031 RepID=UPI002483CFC4|nr:uncharacterized protein LOC129805631 [Phlebotomus papatasi]